MDDLQQQETRIEEPPKTRLSHQPPRRRGIGCGLLTVLLVCALGGMALGWNLRNTALVSRLLATPQPVPTVRAVPTTTVANLPPANALEAQIEEVYRQAGAGVVNITSRSFGYDFFLNPVPRDGSGSGFFWDQQGHIVTNYHVVEGAEELQVALADGRSLAAQVVGLDPSNDLAVIKVDMQNVDVPVVPLGNSSGLRVGQFVVAIGNPFGLERTLTVGVVSSLGRVIDSPNQRFIGEVIQTDAPINPGNSGGPLLNLEGHVIGVNSAILSPSGASAGIGFAIPARTVERVVPALITSGRYPHPDLGVRLLELTPQRTQILARVGMAVPVEQGLLVAALIPGGGAEQAGLRAGRQVARLGNLEVPLGSDIITAINGQPLKTIREFLVYLETQTTVGQTVEVTLIREGKQMTVPVVLSELQG